MQQDSLNQFLEQLINEKGLGNLSEDVKQELKAELESELLAKIDQATIAALSEEEAATLANKLDDPNFSDEDVVAFIRNAGINQEQLALNVMLAFRNAYLGIEG